MASGSRGGARRAGVGWGRVGMLPGPTYLPCQASLQWGGGCRHVEPEVGALTARQLLQVSCPCPRDFPPGRAAMVSEPGRAGRRRREGPGKWRRPGSAEPVGGGMISLQRPPPAAQGSLRVLAKLGQGKRGEGRGVGVGGRRANARPGKVLLSSPGRWLGRGQLGLGV